MTAGGSITLKLIVKKVYQVCNRATEIDVALIRNQTIEELHESTLKMPDNTLTT